MVEILGVLAIIGVLTVAGIAGYSKAMSKYKINKIKDQMTTLISNIKTTYNKYPSYSGLNNESALKNGIIPEDMAIGTRENIIQNNFAGHVYLETKPNASRIQNGAFKITQEGLSKDACIALATTDFSQSLIKVEFGQSEYVGDKLPLDLATAAEGCVCTDNSCTISLTFN